MNGKIRFALFGAIGLSAVLAWVLADPAFSQSDFYQGKTITIIQDSTPGGVGELRTRAIVPVLRKHIPGNPTIIIEFMPGGGGRKGANHLYKVARPDGLTIGRVSSGLIMSQILGLPGVQYDIDKFIYLGSGHHQVNYVFFSRKEAGVDTLEKLRKSSGLRIEGQSVGHSNPPFCLAPRRPGAEICGGLLRSGNGLGVATWGGRCRG